MFNADAGTWAAASSAGKVIQSASFPAALLANGLVLTADGGNAQYYHLVSREWTDTAVMTEVRTGFKLVALMDGRALAVGGLTKPNVASSTAEVYDPNANCWSVAKSMKRPRADGLRAALLANGKVMVVGGDYIDTTTRSTKAPSSQAYNPVYDGWSSIAKLASPRTNFALAAVPGGGALVSGGYSSMAAKGKAPVTTVLASAERWSPKTNKWTPAAPMLRARDSHQMVTLPSGKVLAAGGIRKHGVGFGSSTSRSADDGAKALRSVEIYDPVTDTWTAAAPMATARAYDYSFSLVLLRTGEILAVGGNGAGKPYKGGNTAKTSAEVYNPLTKTWRTVANLPGFTVNRHFQIAT